MNFCEKITFFKKGIAKRGKVWYNTRVQKIQGYSSVGRVPVSKTVGRGFEPFCPCQKIQVERLGFFHLCPQDTTSFACLHATSFRAKREHHCRPRYKWTMLHFVQMKWACAQWSYGFAVNDVALRANGIRPIVLCAEILLIFNRKCGIIKAVRRWYRERR